MRHNISDVKSTPVCAEPANFYQVTPGAEI